MAADPDAGYDGEITLDLFAVEPLVALPGSPDNVVPIGEVEGTSVEQVIVGSCTNGSWEDMYAVTQVVKGRKVHPSLSFILFPGSHRILEVMAREGLVADLLAAGCVISESTCGACPGLGHVPATGTRSLRAFNRNFPGRSGVKDDQVYLCSSVVAAASALRGVISDPRGLGPAPPIIFPARFDSSTAGLVPPASEGEAGSVVKGPNIKEVPIGRRLGERIEGTVLLKLGDKVSTDDILPSGAQILIFRSNIPAIAEFCFKYLDPEFPARARSAGGGVLLAGEHYGQGSSREHAAIAPMYLGVRAVLAKSFARLHRANLINWSILPLEFLDPNDYERVEVGERLSIDRVREGLQDGQLAVESARGHCFRAQCLLTDREREILLAGGLLAHAAQMRKPS